MHEYMHTCKLTLEVNAKYVLPFSILFSEIVSLTEPGDH